MAHYSARRAAEMRQQENAGAAAPRVRVVDGRVSLVALSDISAAPYTTPGELDGEAAAAAEYRITDYAARRGE